MFNRPIVRFLVAFSVVSLFGLASGLVSPARAFTDDHTQMQGSPSSMGQTNGPVWAVEIAGGRIYVGGGFTSTRPHGAARGSQETQQAYLAAFDAETGEPVASFDPVLSNNWSSDPAIVRAMALSPDGETLYVGGDFNRIDGVRAEHVAAFDTSTGDFLGEVGWNGTDGFVAALAVSNDGDTLYVGGAFSRANWTRRADLAAFDLTDGSLRAWNPVISGRITGESLRVSALAVSADDSRVFVAGPFRSMNGEPAQGFMATSAATGENIATFDSGYLYAPTSWGTSLATQGNTVYLGGRDDRAGSGARTEGVVAIDTATGDRRWYARCYGDTFAVLPLGDDVYVASHAHDCAAAGGMPEQQPRVNLAIHALDRDTGEVRPYFVQTSGTRSDPDTLLLSRALATDGTQMVMGGGFLTTNSNPQANLTRFRLGSAAPDRGAWPSGRTCDGCGHVDLRILEAADRDDINLTYEIFRGWQTADPIATIQETSFAYRLETFSFRDTGVARGDRVYYRVRVSDPAGNRVMSVRTPTYVVGNANAAQRARRMGTQLRRPGVTSVPTPRVMRPRTEAQREAQRAAERYGLHADGRRLKRRVAPLSPPPVVEDRSVPTRVGRGGR